MSLPIHAEEAERAFIKSATNLIFVFEDLHINGKIREYMVRLLDDTFQEINLGKFEIEKKETTNRPATDEAVTTLYNFLSV